MRSEVHHHRGSRFAGPLLAGVIATVWGCARQPSESAAVVPVPEFPSAAVPDPGKDWCGTLRAYGKVAAKCEGPGILHIYAESPDKAQLWQAKWWSDFTNTVTGASSVKATALRRGSDVLIVSGRDEKELQERIGRAVPGEQKGWSDSTSVRLPMFLNDLEQYPFQFYYRNELSQERKNEDGTPYDPSMEFDYAKANGHLGFTFWASPGASDWERGMTLPGWAFGYNMAKSRNIPCTINTMISPSTGATMYPGDWHEPPPYSIVRYIGTPTSPRALNSRGTMSWFAKDWRLAAVKTVQKTVAAYNAENVTEILEPHGELGHYTLPPSTERSDKADKAFQAFLKRKYGSLETVARRHQRPYRSWDDVAAPELAAFCGWEQGKAIDLAGDWRRILRKRVDGKEPADAYREFEAQPVKEDEWQPLPEGWEKPGYDDASAQLVKEMPGSDLNLFIQKSPAGLRRAFTLDTVPEGRVWLHVWDMNDQGSAYRFKAWMNGKQVLDEPGKHATMHHGVSEVTGLLKKGANLLALDLPFGFLAYRVYLTTVEPRIWPDLGRGRDELWYDLSCWRENARASAVSMGISAIRQVEPSKPIILMAPGEYSHSIRDLAIRNGGRFHNTGLMESIYDTYLPALMHSRRLPFTLEPSAPAPNLDLFKRKNILWQLEGVNGIHYFIHVGNILWNPEIKAYFEKILPALIQMGRRRPPCGEIAFLHDSLNDNACDTPWGSQIVRGMHSGHWDYQFGDFGTHRDMITLRDFVDGNADRYRAVLDANNLVLDPETVKGIERFVRGGGTFIAQVRTGESGAGGAGAWSLACLSNVRGERFSGYDAHTGKAVTERGGKGGKVEFAFAEADPDGKKFKNFGDGNELVIADGATNVTVLARWKNGTPCITESRVGKGRIITIGARLYPYGFDGTQQLLERLFSHAGVKPCAIKVVGKKSIRQRHFVSVNGLYDILVVGNLDGEDGQEYEITSNDGRKRDFIDLLTGKPLPVKGTIAKNEFVTGVAPRAEAADDAGTQWFAMEAGEWQGAEKPEYNVKDFKDPGEKWTLPLDGGWEVAELADIPDLEKAKAFYAGITNGGFKAIGAGLWKPSPIAGLVKGINCAGNLFAARRTVMIPQDWNDGGEIQLWSDGSFPPSQAVDKSSDISYFINGERIYGQTCMALTDYLLTFKPGESFELGIAWRSGHVSIRGTRMNMFLVHLPKPSKVIDLSGEWERRGDTVLDKSLGKVTFPGSKPGRHSGHEALFQRSFTLDKVPDGRVYLRSFGYVRDTEPCSGVVVGAVINGRFVMRYGHRHGALLYFDVTDFLKAGENDIWLWMPLGPVPNGVRKVCLEVVEGDHQ